MLAALDGLRVLDFTRVLAGPFCTMLLADYGAEVVKIEVPGRGDDTRHWGPPWVGEGENRLSAYYISVNRNKRSLTLNLKTPEGRAIARQLAARSHVLVENFKVGGMAEYGLDFPTLHALNPGLVYCSITGYGQDGPYAERPGYDYAIQGQSGLMSITGPADGQPYKVGVAISDVLTGLMAVNAIQAALYHVRNGGEGQHIDISLLESQIAALVNVASNYLVSGIPPARYGNEHPNIVPYAAYQAADGHFILNVGNDSQFRAACEVIAHPEWATDSRFATNPARVAHRETLKALLEPVFLTRPAEVWVKAFLNAGVPASLINTIPEVFADEQVKARGLVQTAHLPDGTPFDLLAPTARLSATPPTLRHAPPLLGQDSDAILTDWLGLSGETVHEYRARGVI